MLTVPDFMQYEPTDAKIFRFGSRPFALMWAGDSTLQAEVFQHFGDVMREEVHELGPGGVPRTQRIAELYRSSFIAVRRKHAEASLLEPLGLPLADLLDQPPEVAEKLIETMLSLPSHFGDLAVIIAGHDDIGSHLYRVTNAHLACFDTVGFVSIGVGQPHADSLLMVQQYSRGATIPEALLLTYLAKKWSEVAPGVGKATDMFMINHTTELGWYSDGLHRKMVEETLEKIFQDLSAKDDRSMAEAHDAVRDLFPAKKADATPPSPPAESAPEPPAASTHDS